MHCIDITNIYVWSKTINVYHFMVKRYLSKKLGFHKNLIYKNISTSIFFGNFVFLTLSCEGHENLTFEFYFIHYRINSYVNLDY